MSKAKKQKILNRIKERFVGTEGKRTSPLLHVGLLVLIAICGIVYLVEINATSAQGFKIRSLEQQVSQLEEIQRELELRQVDASSLQVLSERAEDLQLVSVDTVEALAPQDHFALGR